MIYDRELLQRLDRFAAAPWRGIVFRHMFGDYPPDSENTRGARWNPPETPAIYTSLTRDVALAEAEFQIGLQPVRPRAKRTIHQIGVALNAVVDLSDQGALAELGIAEAELVSLDYVACQRVGGAIEWLEHDGLVVPSGRARGTNLIIFPNRQREGYGFRVMSSEVIDAGRA